MLLELQRLKRLHNIEVNPSGWNGVSNFERFVVVSLSVTESSGNSLTRFPLRMNFSQTLFTSKADFSETGYKIFVIIWVEKNLHAITEMHF